MQVENLIAQYNRVFDDKGNIRPCGREECRKLIMMCEKLQATKGFDFGNSDSGFMNVENIKSYVEKLKAN